MRKTRTLNNLSLSDITPYSIKNDLQIQALIASLDPELKQITGQINETVILARIDELNESILDYLAWQLHLDFYDLAANLDIKRSQIKDSIQWHMHKGTKWAILKALDMIGVDGEIINWYEENAQPYTFRVNAVIRDGYYKAADKDNIFENIVRAINESKAARSYLTSLQAKLLRIMNISYYSGIALGHTGSIYIKLPDIEPPKDTQINAAMIKQLSGNAVIYHSLPEDQNLNLKIGTHMTLTKSYILGVDEKDMQDLLEKFAQRVFNRLDDFDKRISELEETMQLLIEAYIKNGA